MNVKRRIIDVHAHILPGVDDGAREMDESIQMLRLAVDQGITGVIATPHMSRHFSGAQLRELAAKLQERAQEIFPGFRIYPGQEALYHEGLVEQLRSGQVLTIAGGRHVLVEFQPSVSYGMLYRGIRQMLSAGYVPILAHVERYACLRDQRSLSDLADSGCLLQMNYDSLEGHFFQAHVRWCRKQVQEGMIHLLGTDMHRMDHRTPELTGAFAWMSRHVPEQQIERMTYENPIRVIGEQGD